MKPSDYLYLALTSIKEKRGRAIGAVIGVMIAVVALSAALGIGESFQENFVEELQRTVAANSIIVTGGYSGGFTDADIAYFKRVPGVRDAFGIVMTAGTAVMAGGEQPVTIVAIDPQYLPVYLGVSDMSRVVEEGSLRPSGLGVLVSNSLWRDLSTGQKRLDVGSPLAVRVGSKDVILFVVGLMRQSFILVGGHSVLNQIFMDSSAYFTYISNSRSYSVVIILVSDLGRLDEIVSEVRSLAPPGSNVISAAAVVRQVTGLVNALQMFIALISAVGIGVTALWIFDSTTISVVQRTREIGILKALGYTSRDILLIFLLEVVIISAIGIAGGVLISLVLSLLVKIPMFTFEVGLKLAPHVLVISSLLPLAMNVLAAYIPSRRGSSLNPVEALRYE